jgi:HD-GYP domain-containing protein (c-di-GMP phosphodiesterase class II)
LAIITTPLTWYLSREQAEGEVVTLAMEESRRVMSHLSFDAPIDLVHESAGLAARNAIGGLFDIAEIYDNSGGKLAESLTQSGERIERLLPKHGRPGYREASYESLSLGDDLWVLRVFVPIYQNSAVNETPVAFFEGVRVIPEAQREQMLRDAMILALIVGGSALLCGLAIYPVVVHLTRDNLRQAREILESHISITEALGRAIARRDSDTGAHNYRVAWIAARIGEHLKLSRGQMQALIVGSFLHDVGKIAIPDAILLKPGRLDETEMSIMRTHVEQGEAIVSGIDWLSDAAEVVSGHHEKWDGTGYPRGLAQEQIPLSARIFAVADVFDALCSKRPYKEAHAFDAVINMIVQDAGRHFDPKVVDQFIRIARDLHNRLLQCDEQACRELLRGKIREYFAL